RSISVSSPKFRKNIRLDDPIFSEDFRPYDYIPIGIREKQKQYEQDKQSSKDKPSKILSEALEVLEEGTRIKAEYHQERFQGIDVPKPFDLDLDAPERAQEHTADPQPKPKEQDNSPSMGL